MLYIIFLFFCLFALVVYLSFGKNILSPTFSLTVCFCLSCFFAIIGNEAWNVSVSSSTFLVFLIALPMMALGECFSNSFFIKKNNVANISCFCEVKFYKIFLFLIIQLIIFFLYYQRILEIAIAAGYQGENLLKYVRIATINLEIKLGVFFSCFLWIVNIGSFVPLYILIDDFCKKNRRLFIVNFVLASSVVFGIASFCLSGARFGLMQMMLFGLTVFLQKKIFAQEKIGKLFVLVIIFLIILVTIMSVLLSVRLGDENRSVFQLFCVYIGSPIVALSSWLEVGNESSLLGEESFFGLRVILHSLFSNIELTSQFNEFTIFPGGGSTNIYTAYRAFISDFGWFGMAFLNFIIGFVYASAYNGLVQKFCPRNILIYNFFFFYLLSMIFSPLVTSSLFTTTQIMGCFWLLIIGWWLMGKSFVQNS